jgi:hypothetical protein
MLCSVERYYDSEQQIGKDLEGSDHGPLYGSPRPSRILRRTEFRRRTQSTQLPTPSWHFAPLTSPSMYVNFIEPFIVVTLVCVIVTVTVFTAIRNITSKHVCVV